MSLNLAAYILIIVLNKGIFKKIIINVCCNLKKGLHLGTKRKSIHIQINIYSKKVFIKISEMPDDNIKMIRVCLVPLKKTIQFLYINDKKQLKNNRSA